MDATATRLFAIASLVPPGSRVADIGTGHGRLARWLVASGVASHCIASDRWETSGPGPAFRPHPRLELRYGDGLAVLRPGDRIDVIVVAGLGAGTIARILEEGGAPSARLVLQPQNRPAELRRFLLGRGMTLVAERLAYERGRVYFVLGAEPASGQELPRHARLDADDLIEAGPCLVGSRDPLLERYWRTELARCESIRRSLAGAEQGLAVGRREALARRVLEAIVEPAR